MAPVKHIGREVRNFGIATKPKQKLAKKNVYTLPWYVCSLFSEDY